jgi:hypothetical protein
VDWSQSGLLPKSLCGVPTLYAWSLAYGRNLLRRPLTARELLVKAEELYEANPKKLEVPALLDALDIFIGMHEERGRGPSMEIEPWRIRNLKPWIRSNPPVGALGDKERPATSYITVACTSRDRWFDLDAVRTRSSQDPATYTGNGYTKGRPEGIDGNEAMPGNPGGAPPLDWWHHVDAIIDHEIDQRAGKANGGANRGNHAGGLDGRLGQDREGDRFTDGGLSVGARGVHIRRALERAGILTTLDAHDISPRGYTGAHYAVWPPELVRQLVDEMCPRRVCTVCGQPSRRIVGETTYVNSKTGKPTTTLHFDGDRRVDGENHWDTSGKGDRAAVRVASTLGWSDCGHNTWRPGRILDPFVGSGTTLAVASGMGRDSVGIDIDERSADLARERCGMFLEVDYPAREMEA